MKVLFRLFNRFALQSLLILLLHELFQVVVGRLKLIGSSVLQVLVVFDLSGFQERTELTVLDYLGLLLALII